MNFRRYYVPNAIVFITNVVQYRQPVFANDAHVALLLQVLREVRRLHPFNMLGYVILPDHFHLMIQPTQESNFSKIMQSCKTNFTKEYKRATGVSGPMKFWQKRFYDHVIRSEDDFGMIGSPGTVQDCDSSSLHTEATAESSMKQICTVAGRRAGSTK